MMTKQTDTITDAEWEVMRVVWTKRQTTSNEIIDVLEKKKEWKPSTVKTLLSRLVTKRYLETQKIGKQLLYQATITEDRAITDLKNAFLTKICQKKIGSVILETLIEEEVSLSDIEKIENVLTEKKQTAKQTVSCNCLKGQCRC